MAHDVFVVHADLDKARREVVEFDIIPIEGHEPAVGIEDAETVAHVL